MTPVEFRGDLWRQKTRVPALSCGVVCVILRLAILVEHRLVTDRQTDRHRQTQGQWCIAKNGGGYTQTGVAKGLKVPCLFMIAEVNIRCQKTSEVGIRRIPAYTPQYTTAQGHG